MHLKLLLYILPNNFIASKKVSISFSCGLNWIKIFLFDLHFTTFLFIVSISPILFSIFIQSLINEIKLLLFHSFIFFPCSNDI